MKKGIERVVLGAILLLAGYGINAWGQAQPGVQVADLNDMLDEIAPAMAKGNIQRALDVMGDGIKAQDAAGNTILMALIASQKYLGAARLELMKALIEKGIDVAMVNDQGKTALILAAEKDDFDAVKVLLENAGVRAKINVADKAGETALVYAAHRANRDMMKLLIANGATTKIEIALKDLLDDIEPSMTKGNAQRALDIIGEAVMARDTTRNNILMLLIASQRFLGPTRLELIQGLIDKGVDVAMANDQGKTALILAAEKGDLDAVKLLLDNGADIKKKDTQGHDALYYLSHTIDIKNKRTVLMSAAVENKRDVVEFLLGLKVDTEVKDANGWTALMFAVEHGSPELVQVLLNADADPTAMNSNGATPLVLAVRLDKPDIVDVLLGNRAGWASIDIFDKEGKTPLYRAVEKKSAPLMQKLLAKNASGKVTAEKDGRTPLTIAVRNSWVDGVKLLLAKGSETVNVDTKEANGWTALMIAIEKGNLEIVQLLLKAGADVLTQNLNGMMPLTLAIKVGNEDIVDLLLNNRNVLAYSMEHVDKEGKTALFRAVEKKSVPLVQKLLAKGANSRVTGEKDGITPLMLAARENWIEGVKLMIDKDPQGVNFTDKQNKTALMHAAQALHWDMIKLLEGRGADTRLKDKQGNDAYALALQQYPLFSVKDDLREKVLGERCSNSYGYITSLVCLESERFCIGNQCGFRCKVIRDDFWHYSIRDENRFLNHCSGGRYGQMIWYGKRPIE